MGARCDLHFASLLFDVAINKVPEYLADKLVWANSNVHLKTRGASWKMVIPPHNTAAFRGSFRYLATKCWNNLPPPIRQAKTKVAFKNNFKKHLLYIQLSTP